METLEKNELAQRTRERNASLWMILDWGGLLDPLTNQQADLNLLGQSGIENRMVVSDEAWEIKESQQTRKAELDQAEIEQDRRLADDKVALGRAQLAIRQTTDEYLLAVRIYDSNVRNLLMAAREYAAQVEQEQLAVEESRALLGAAKEGLRQEQINAQIYFESIQRVQVEVEMARAQVDVVKAHVRAALANIEADRAEVDLLEAQVQQYVAEADKITLQADVATIYAEILTKKLSEIRLDVGHKEIEAGFSYLQARLQDMLAHWDQRRLAEEIMASAEAELLTQIDILLEAEKYQEDLHITEVLNAQENFGLEKDAIRSQTQMMKEIIDELTKVKIGISNDRTSFSISRVNKETWAKALENAARCYVHKNMAQQQTHLTTETLTISGK